MPENDEDVKETEKGADKLKTLANAYLECKSEAQRKKLRDQITVFLLRSPAARGMIRSMLMSRGKNQDRFEDAQQDAVSLFVMTVLPKLRNALSVWGAFKGAIKVVGQRINVDFYDHERMSSVSLDDLRDQFDSEHSYAQNLLTRDENSDHEEQSLIEQMAVKRAKEKIYEILLASKMNGKNPLSWLTKLNEPFHEMADQGYVKIDQSKPEPAIAARVMKASQLNALPVVRLIAQDTEPGMPLEAIKAVGPAKWATPRHNAKIEPTPGYERLIQIRDDAGLTNETLAKALNIGIARLRSYVNLKSPVHTEVLTRAEQWYRGEGKRRKELLDELRQKSLHEWIETWKEQTGAPSYAALAEILDISVPTMTRWRKPQAKAMHNEHLINAALRVKRHTRLPNRRQRN